MFPDFSLLSYLPKGEKNIFINEAVVLFYIVRKINKKYIYIYVCVCVCIYIFSISSSIIFCFSFACCYNDKIDDKER